MNFTNEADEKIQKYFESTIEGRSGLGYKGKSKQKKKINSLFKMNFKKSNTWKSDFNS